MHHSHSSLKVDLLYTYKENKRKTKEYRRHTVNSRHILNLRALRPSLSGEVELLVISFDRVASSFSNFSCLFCISLVFQHSLQELLLLLNKSSYSHFRHPSFPQRCALHWVPRAYRSAMETSLMPFYERREELSVHDGCLLWGNRVVVPKTYRGDVLVQLHEGHPGTTRMKGLSRMYVWWPGISKDVEETVQDCIPCQQQQSKPPVAPLHPWAWPTRPWARLGAQGVGFVHAC